MDATHIVQGFKRDDADYLTGYADGLDLATEFCGEPTERTAIQNISDVVRDAITRLERED